MARPKVVQFWLTEDEFEEVSAAERSRLARGPFAAQTTLAVARGTQVWVESPMPEVFTKLVAAVRLVRRIDMNVNREVARLNATGQRGDDPLPAAQFCVRVIRRLDEAAGQVTPQHSVNDPEHSR